jgi:outer membrane lipoprotein-sorting protein
MRLVWMYRKMLLYPVITCMLTMTCVAQDQPQPSTPLETTPAPRGIGATFRLLRDHLRGSPLDFQTSFTAESDLHGTMQGKSHFLIQQPNLFRIETASGDDTYVAISDGRVMTIYNPKERKFAEWPAPVSTRQGLNLAQGLMSRESQVLRFITVLEAAAAGGLSIDAVGAEAVGGRQCDRFTIVASKEEVWKVWLDTNEVPLPCKFVTANQTSEFSWNQNPGFPLNTFVFVPPKGGEKVSVNDLGLRPAQKIQP